MQQKNQVRGDHESWKDSFPILTSPHKGKKSNLFSEYFPLVPGCISLEGRSNENTGESVLCGHEVNKSGTQEQQELQEE